MDSNFKILYAMLVMIYVIDARVNISDISIITVKNVYNHCTMDNISIFEAINLLKSDVLENRGYI